MHQGRHKHGALGAAVNEAFIYAFGRTKRRRMAAIERGARALALHRGRVDTFESLGGPTSYYASRRETDPGDTHGVVAVFPSRGRADGPFADRDVVRFVVSDSDAARAVQAKHFRGFPVEITTLSDLESGLFGDVASGQHIAPSVAPSNFGTITCAFTRGITSWVMTCSHVALPTGPGSTDATLFAGSGSATVKYFSTVASGPNGCAIDVAVASTLNPIDDHWHDGAGLGTIVAPAAAQEPFSLQGAVNPNGTFSSFEPESAVGITLATGKTVNYAGQHQFRLDGPVAVEHGDSGGAVRDAQDRLIGIVVGRGADGSGYFTPIDRIKSWLTSKGL